jgi:phospholipase D1/2
VPKTKTGHVVPGLPLSRVKDRLSQVRGALVECPLVSLSVACSAELFLTHLPFMQDFLIDQNDFVEGPEWNGLNPTLPIYI